MSRFGAMLLAGWLLTTGTAVAADPPDIGDTVVISDSLAVQRISEHVWIHTTSRQLGNGRRFPANGLVVRTDDGVVLVDTAWGVEPTTELLGWVEESFDQPVVGAVVTHFHDDSLGGAAALDAAGVPYFSGQVTRDVAAAGSLPEPSVVAGLARPGGAAGFHGLEIFYPGPGHSADNVVVWVPEDRLLFGSCAVRSPQFPGAGNVADASLDHWPEAIRSVRSRYPGAIIVVPGHGPAGGAELLDHTLAVLAGTRTDAGKPR